MPSTGKIAEDPYVYLVMGDIALRQNQLKTAEDSYVKALREDAGCVEAAQRLYVCSQKTTKGVKISKLKQNARWLAAMRESQAIWLGWYNRFPSLSDEWKTVLYYHALDAAHDGVPAAMQLLQYYYERGCGIIPMNPERAKYWREKHTKIVEALSGSIDEPGKDGVTF